MVTLALPFSEEGRIAVLQSDSLLLSSLTMMNERGMRTCGILIWREDERDYKPAPPTVYQASKKAELNHHRYAILESKANCLLLTSANG